MPFYDIDLTNDVEFDKKIEQFSEMTHSERSFLYSLIKMFKPRKLLEVGVAEGASSALILNCMDKDAHLHSIDINENAYCNPDRKTGWRCSEIFSGAIPNWTLYTGATPARFMDKIGKGIDFCFLDSMHCLPGELLNFIEVLPYLKEDAVICVHDITVSQPWMLNPNLINLRHKGRQGIACLLLLTILRGDKIFPDRTEHKYFPNIGAVRLNKETRDCLDDLFLALTLPWQGNYKLSDDNINTISNQILKNYGQSYQALFNRIVMFQHDIYETDKKYQEIKMAPLRSFIEEVGIILR